MKKNLLLLLLAFLAGNAVTAQATPPLHDSSAKSIVTSIDDDDSTIIFYKVEHAPVFKGGDTAWNHFLQRNLNYPIDALREAIYGTVSVSFIVNKDGTLSDVKAILSPGKPLSIEAIRILKLSSGNWLSAIQNGHPVRCLARKSIQFKLSN